MRRIGCWTRSAIGLAAATMLLAGCGTGGSSVPPVVCPAIVEYDPAFLADTADEVAVLPIGSGIVVMLEDYGALRNQVRACRGTAPRPTG